MFSQICRRSSVNETTVKCVPRQRRGIPLSLSQIDLGRRKRIHIQLFRSLCRPSRPYGYCRYSKRGEAFLRACLSSDSLYIGGIDPFLIYEARFFDPVKPLAFTTTSGWGGPLDRHDGCRNAVGGQIDARHPVEITGRGI